MSAQPNPGMQVTTFDNPMGIDGFEFVEFASPEPQHLHTLFKQLGFSAVLRHRLLLSPAAEIEGKQIDALVADMVEQTAAPR